jgi:hypothetical protein
MLTDDNCKKLREYLLRGGFLMTDDFHGTEEWEVFIGGMNRIFPDRPIVEIENSDAIFHAADPMSAPGARSCKLSFSQNI